MNNNIILMGAAAAAISGCNQPQKENGPISDIEKPNIVFFFIDDLGWPEKYQQYQKNHLKEYLFL